MQYDAFIFDLDGTLINTQMVDFAIHRDLLADLGYELSPLTYAAVFGKTRLSMIENLLRHVKNPPSTSTYLEEYVPRLEEALSARPDLLVQHAHTFLHEAFLQGIPLALATSSPRSVLPHIAAIEKILPLFHVIVTVEDVGRPKPDPEIFSRAKTLLGSQNPFIFEDSLPGCLAANRAGISFATHVHSANHSALRVVKTMEAYQFDFHDYANARVQQLLLI